jgi:hypothetical protein
MRPSSGSSLTIVYNPRAESSSFRCGENQTVWPMANLWAAKDPLRGDDHACPSEAPHPIDSGSGALRATAKVWLAAPAHLVGQLLPLAQIANAEMWTKRPSIRRRAERTHNLLGVEPLNGSDGHFQTSHIRSRALEPEHRVRPRHKESGSGAYSRWRDASRTNSRDKHMANRASLAMRDSCYN